MLSFDDNNWPAVAENLQNLRNKWGCFSRLMVLEGDDNKTSGIFFCGNGAICLVLWVRDVVGNAQNP